MSKAVKRSSSEPLRGPPKTEDVSLPMLMGPRSRDLTVCSPTVRNTTVTVALGKLAEPSLNEIREIRPFVVHFRRIVFRQVSGTGYDGVGSASSRGKREEYRLRSRVRGVETGMDWTGFAARSEGPPSRSNPLPHLPSFPGLRSCGQRPRSRLGDRAPRGM